jgi:transglutaminase-like putative cysteine protease
MQRKVIGVAAITVWLLPLGSAAQNVRTRTFEFTYVAEVRDIPSGTRTVSIWLPYPPSDENQQISDVRIHAPAPWRLTRDPEYGNQILYIRVEAPTDPLLRVEVRFRVQRREYIRRPGAVRTASLVEDSDPLLTRWLQPDRLVPIDGWVRERALEVTRDARTDLEKARAIYEWTVSNIRYDKSGTGWGRGDIYYACHVKRGNCTDFHAAFIGFARAVGIPARFEIGFPLPPERGQGEISGYHCWAQFYLKGHGWVPVDASEAGKTPALRDYFFGAHDENRVLFTIGRDIRLEPPQQGEPLNYFIYPYVEVDGRPFPNVEKRFYFRDLP